MDESLTDSNGGDTSSERPGKRKRAADDPADDDSTDDKESIDKTSINSEPRVQTGIVEFDLSSLIGHFTCAICCGLYKDPMTITACLHSFCRSCLYRYFATGIKKCPHPRCGSSLEPDPYKLALQDRTLESLCDKVLFVDVKERDDIEEKNFYASRKILRKPELESDTMPETATPLTIANDELDLLLMPDEQADSQHKLPRLERPCIRTSGRLRIVHLKKYLLGKLDKPQKLLPCVEIRCRNDALGNDHSLAYIERTLWLKNECMRLDYRFSEDLLV